MIGAELPFGFFKSIGIKLNNEWDVRRWVFLTTAFLFVYSLYALKSYGKGCPPFRINSSSIPRATTLC